MTIGGPDSFLLNICFVYRFLLDLYRPECRNGFPLVCRLNCLNISISFHVDCLILFSFFSPFVILWFQNIVARWWKTCIALPFFVFLFLFIQSTLMSLTLCRLCVYEPSFSAYHSLYYVVNFVFIWFELCPFVRLFLWCVFQKQAC